MEAETLRLQSDSPELEWLTEAELNVLSLPDAKPDEAAAVEADKAAAEATAKAEADAAAAATNAAEAKPAEAAKEAKQKIAPTFVPAVGEKNERDFNKEIAELDAKYDSGEIDLADYRKERDTLVTTRAKVEALAEANAQIQKSHVEFQNRLFNAAVSTFFSDPAHQDFVADDKGNATPEFRTAFQRAVDFVDDASMSAAELVERAYTVLKATQPSLFKAPAAPVVDAAAVKAAADKAAADAAAIAKAKADAEAARKPNLKDVPATLATAPNAGVDKDQSSEVDDLASKDTEELEDIMARMQPGKLEELLRKTPGSDIRGVMH